MIKTAQELSDQLRSAKDSSETLQIDPVTSSEQWLRSMAVLGFLGLWICGIPAYKMGLEKGMVYCGISLLSLVVIIFTFAYNEYWEIDLAARKFRSVSSLLGMRHSSVSFDFAEIKSVAVSGHRHSRKGNNSSSTRRWWEYGLAVFCNDGKLHRVFPNLSKNFKDVWGTAEAMALLVDVPLVEPVAMAELVVDNTAGQASLAYKEGQNRRALFQATPKAIVPESTVAATPKTTDPESTVAATPKATDPESTVAATPKATDPESTVSATPKATVPESTVSATPKATVPEGTVSATPKATDPESTVAATPNDKNSISAPVRSLEDRGRLEFPQDFSSGPQAGCAAMGLFFVAPFALAGFGMMFANDGTSKLLGFVLCLLTAPALYWLLGWLMDPIVRTVNYVDPSGAVGTQQFRRRGKSTEREVKVPDSGRIVLREYASGESRRLDLVLKDETKFLWAFTPPANREQGEKDGRKIALTLGIPFETDSDFER